MHIIIIKIQSFHPQLFNIKLLYQGSGKTVIFELAILNLLNKSNNNNKIPKIIYICPIKALCSERCQDWKTKFNKYGIICIELTGDNETSVNSIIY